MKTLLEIKDDVCKKIFHFRYKNLLEKLSSNNHNFTETEIDHFINEVAYTLHEPSSPTVKESETGEQEEIMKALEEARCLDPESPNWSYHAASRIALEAIKKTRKPLDRDGKS